MNINILYVVLEGYNKIIGVYTTEEEADKKATEQDNWYYEEYYRDGFNPYSNEE